MKKLTLLLVFVAGALLGHVNHDRVARLFTPLPKAAPLPRTSAEAVAARWTCSMDPQVKLPTPGACPICGMDLIPMAGEDDSGRPRLALSREEVDRMRVETAPVERRAVSKELRMVGRIEYDKTRMARITVWAAGRIEQLFVDYPGTRVQPGDHMVQLYSSELYSAQQELLQILEAARRGTSSALEQRNEANVQAARERLESFGLTKDQIRELEERGEASAYITLYAPRGGVVVEKNVNEGEYVNRGQPLFLIADPTRLWVDFDAYEDDLTWIRYGQRVSFEAQAFPGEPFQGIVSFIDPEIDPRTRTVKVRVVAHDPLLRLKPEMFVRGTLASSVSKSGKVIDQSLAGKWISPMHPEIVKDGPGQCDVCGMDLVRPEDLGFLTEDPGDDERPLVVPVTAVLRTGKRAIVYVQDQSAEMPTYEGREVRLGVRAGDRFVVESGLTEGELVVVQGNFKIDSALEIRAKPSMMMPPEESSAHPEHPEHGTDTEGPM